jgi:threonine dehydrogenase-like Zn-dependent dehydrogenase
MRGVVFLGDRELEMMAFHDSTPGPGEVVLEMKASGMCGTDLKFYRRAKGGDVSVGVPAADAPVIAGHEPCGVVAALGPGVDPRRVREGMRAMVHHYVGCGYCPDCRGGWGQLCQQDRIVVYGSNAHGAHAPFMKVPAATLVPLDERLSFATGAAISCGTGTAFAALRRLGLGAVDSVAIFGQGPVGLSGTQLAKAMGARVIALDVSAERLLRAREFGADETINPAETDAVAAIRALTNGLGCDVAFETSGSQEGRLGAVRGVKVWGRVAFVGEGGNFTLDVSSEMIRRQVTIFGHWTFSLDGQAECARFIAERSIAVDRLFTDRWGLDQAAEAYRRFDQQSGGKGVFLM